MTHSELVQRAVRWLRNTKECSVVIAEMSSSAFEQPDAIGWRGSMSFVVECKVSMSDFLADSKKPWRRNPASGMGRLRYYFAPADLAQRIADSEQRIGGWGVVAVHPTKCRTLIDSGAHKGVNQNSEVRLLSSVIMRLGAASDRAVSARLYKHDAPNPRAEIHITNTAPLLELPDYMRGDVWTDEETERVGYLREKTLCENTVTRVERTPDPEEAK